jgi:hypothetical protein
MQRPLMDPTFLPDVPAPKKGRKSPLRLLARAAVFPFRLIGRVLFYNPWRRRPVSILAGSPPPEERRRGSSLFQRFCKALLYRLVFVPVFMALAIAALVYAGTHPRQTASDLDPTSEGVYYDAVSFLSEDEVRLDGWLVPVLEPKVVIAQKEQALKIKHSAVVLVHDFGSQRQQMMPLVRPLHDSGMVVLVVSLRGGGSGSVVGSTFGLRDSMDVKAAVQMLRNRVYVDPNRIAVVGIGTGASAALLAGSDDPRIAVLVLDHPVLGGQQVVTDYIGPRDERLRWMQPLIKWAFEFTYRVDADDLEWSRLAKVIRSRPVLMLDGPAARGLAEKSTVIGIRDFLKANLKNSGTASAR